jgi:two-component system sensor histidine kinase VicK
LTLDSSELTSHLLSILEAQTSIAQAPLDSSRLMSLVATHAQALTGASGATVAVVEGDYLHYVAGSGSSENFNLRIPIAGSLSGLCLRTGEVLVSADTHDDDRVFLAGEHWRVASASVAPLTYAGEAVGVLMVVSDRRNAFGEHEVSTLKLVTGLLGAALGHAQLFAERARAQAETQALNRRLSTVLRAVTEVGIIGVDLQGGITFFSEGAERMLGYRSDEVVGRTPMLFHDPEEVRHGLELLGVSPTELFIGPALQGKPHTGDWWYIRKDGSRLLVSLTITPMRDESGDLVGFIGVSTDSTERRATERMKDEFISIVSHELRTPLTGIRGALGLLTSGVVVEIPREAQRMLEIALNNTDRLIRLVSDMLDLDRISSGATQLQLAECDLGDLMQQAADVMLPVASKTGVAILTRPLHVTVMADADRMIQVLTNLLSNAIKFSPSHTGIEVTAERSGENLVIVSVRDHGPGIPTDHLERIFDRFLQVDSSDARARGGSGLGLTISRLIVEQHGGRMWADNAPDSGAVLSLELPMAQP